MEDKYIPISCESYDQLEELAVKKTCCNISYFDKNNIELTMKSQIINFITKDKEEFLVLEKGTKIRLDKVISVNGITLDKSC
jgi:transcriptional antiterminator Rof (Rho-off)